MLAEVTKFDKVCSVCKSRMYLAFHNKLRSHWREFPGGSHKVPIGSGIAVCGVWARIPMKGFDVTWFQFIANSLHVKSLIYTFYSGNLVNINCITLSGIIYSCMVG